jgi:structure-specific recognition protein 1
MCCNTHINYCRDIARLTVFMKGDTSLRFQGFKPDALAKFEEFGKDKSKELKRLETSIKGYNWFKTDFRGTDLSFDYEGKRAFELNLTTVGQAVIQGKNEVALEFRNCTADDIGDTELLCEMRVFVPRLGGAPDGGDADMGEEGKEAEEKAEGGSSAEDFHRRLLDAANLSISAGESIAAFEALMFLVPRGRFQVRSVCESVSVSVLKKYKACTQTRTCTQETNRQIHR